MIRTNIAKKKMLEGQPVVGCFTSLADPAVMEVLGRIGFDFVVLDNEHASMDKSVVGNIMRASELAGIQTTPIVRVREGTDAEILNVLDLGALGVQIPQVDTYEQAKQAVEATFYPPKGTRGLGSSQRAIGYGFLPKDEYFGLADSEILRVIQCESVESVQNLDRILEIPGIDVVFIGATDLSCSMGKEVRGKRNHPKLIETVDAAVEKIVKSGKIAGAAVVSEAEAKHLLKRGVRYLCVGQDLGYLRKLASENLTIYKRIIGEIVS